MTAFYDDDDTGRCFQCFKSSTTNYMGLPLCDEHADSEMAKDMQL